MKTAELPEATTPPVKADRPGYALPTAALVWALWGVITLVVLLRTGTWTIPIAVLATVGLTWTLLATHGRGDASDARHGAATVLVGAGSVLVAVWFVLALVVRREGGGGDVLWVLPSYAPTSGGEFGGAVTTGHLTSALLDSLRGLALLSVLALLLRAVDAYGWFRMARLVLGPVADLVAPLAALGDASTDQRQERRALRRHGVDLGSAHLGGSVAADLWRRMRIRGDELTRLVPAHGTSTSIIAVLVSVVVLLTALHRAVAPGLELAALALLVTTAIAVMRHVVVSGERDRSCALGGAELAALFSGATLVVAHLVVVRPFLSTGTFLSTDAVTATTVDATVVAALLVLPVLMFLSSLAAPAKERR